MHGAPFKNTAVFATFPMFNACPKIVTMVPPDSGPYVGNIDSITGSAYVKMYPRNPIKSDSPLGLVNRMFR